MKRLRILFPNSAFMRHLYLSFLKLIESDKADIEVVDGGMELVAKGHDVRPVLSSAIERAIELGQDFEARNLISDFPINGNDRKVFSKVMRSLGLSEENSMLDALERFAELIRNSGNDLQAHLSGNSPIQETFSPFQAFLLDFYAMTRAPFFDGEHHHGVKLNLYQLLLCAAGYIAARHVGIRERKKFITTLLLPLQLGITKYDFHKYLKEHIKELPGLSPEEALILWMALHLPPDFPESILVLGVKEPYGQNSAELVTASSINLSELWLRAGDRLAKLSDDKKMKDQMIDLLRHSFKMRAQRSPEVDDAVEYVKLLFLAIQGYERERTELVLRASRREATFALSKDQNLNKRRFLASIARRSAQRINI